MTTYTNREVIEKLLDAMRRSDPDYTKSHGLKPTFDHERDMAIQVAEDHLEELDANPTREVSACCHQLIDDGHTETCINTKGITA